MADPGGGRPRILAGWVAVNLAYGDPRALAAGGVRHCGEGLHRQCSGGRSGAPRWCAGGRSSVPWRQVARVLAASGAHPGGGLLQQQIWWHNGSWRCDSGHGLRQCDSSDLDPPMAPAVDLARARQRGHGNGGGRWARHRATDRLAFGLCFFYFINAENAFCPPAKLHSVVVSTRQDKLERYG